MLSNILHRGVLPVLFVCSLLSTGCARAAAGHANFSLASTKVYSGEKDGVTVLKHVDRELCEENAVLLFVWGDEPDHEYLIKSILDETGGDAITNASLNFTALPLILYNRSCAEVEGDVVRFTKPAAAASPAPVTAPPTKEEG